VLPHIRSGKLKGLAISSAQRLAVLPEFPTIAEAGLAGYEATSWQGIVAPAATPRAIVMTLNGEIRRALQLPEIGARLAAEGSEPGNTTPDEFGAYIRREIAKWARVVKTSGIKTD
jgi:tripartite-type tricarboxylate transporter receptor subunit TctC